MQVQPVSVLNALSTPLFRPNPPTDIPTHPIQLVSRLVVVAVLLLCAVGVTKLMKMSRDLSTSIIWKNDILNQQVMMRGRWEG